MPDHHVRPLRPGVSESFPYPTRHSHGPHPLAYFDVGAGPAVVLIHGLAANFTHWEHVAPSLARGHRVIGVDLPGCGLSAERPLPYTIDGYVDAIVALLDELGEREAMWVGHSLGGMVAVAASRRWPERVTRMALVNGAGFQRYPLPLRLASRLVPERALSKVLERMAVKLLEQVFSERNSYTARFISQVDGRPHHPTVDECARTIASLLPELSRRHFLDDIDRIAHPTLVIWGDQDRLLAFRDVPSWVARLPDARLVVLRGCGHMPIIERPPAVVEALLAFSAEAQRAQRRVHIA
jgi:pimeloyl-ACP methyl ester carboxylesterase